MNETQTVPPPLTFSERLYIAGVIGIGLVLLAWAGYQFLSPPPPREDLARKARNYVRLRKPAPLTAPLAELLAKPDLFLVESQPHPLLGKPAPDFTLLDHTGKPTRLRDFIDRGPVVLVYYYGYFCDHCVAQLFSLDEDLPRFKELGAEVIAVSADSPSTTTERFAEFGPFSFPTLSDPEYRASRQYGTYEPAQGDRPARPFHGTFIIGRDGLVHWADIGDQPFVHTTTLLYEVARLEGRLPKGTPTFEPAAGVQGEP